MKVINNTRNQQFEIYQGDHKAEIVYRFRKKTMFMMHTSVPKEMGGLGVGTKLVTTALEYAKEQGFKIAVLCPFVGAYVKKNPEWYDLYDREFHQNIPSN